ncbi:hypothetical protein FOL47_004105 [Perkinsus chesapeaki]|uniref:Uncharacterized protein n=1 Tax=Perkinsus chesapeaki TaxID=330153 RepID=A0A7J6M4L1_PERCH|nr:hypothetical protein FOL47_004105 [Perkinsus chesapeaki]
MYLRLISWLWVLLVLIQVFQTYSVEETSKMAAAPADDESAGDDDAPDPDNEGGGGADGDAETDDDEGGGAGEGGAGETPDKDEKPIEQKPASDPLDLRILDDEAEAGERQSNLLSLAGSFINRAYMRLGFAVMLREYELQIEKKLKVLNSVVEQISAQGESWIEELKTFPSMQKEVIARHKEMIDDIKAKYRRVMPKSEAGASEGGGDGDEGAYDGEGTEQQTTDADEDATEAEADVQEEE